MSKSIAETTHRQSDWEPCLLTAARLYLNSQPESPQHWGQVDPNLNDYHSDPMENCGTFWLPDITDWCHQQEETHSKYANLSDGACDIFSILQHAVRVEATYSLGWEDISWRQSETNSETLQKQVVVEQFAPATDGNLVGDSASLDPTTTKNNMELNEVVEERYFAQNR